MRRGSMPSGGNLDRLARAVVSGEASPRPFDTSATGRVFRPVRAPDPVCAYWTRRKLRWIDVTSALHAVNVGIVLRGGRRTLLGFALALRETFGSLHEWLAL